MANNLTQILKKRGGRDNIRHVSTRHMAARKRYLRIIDFKRDKKEVTGLFHN